jgi:sugar lactone lactonase YvrE
MLALPLFVAASAWSVEPDGVPEPTVEAVAGSGPVFPQRGGFGGDGGPATAARLNHPAQAAAAPDGSIVFTDSENERIRRIAPDGTIATVAGDGRKCPAPTDPCGDGGPAVAAQLNVPHDVAVPANGTILIADTFDNRIRRVGLDGTITTVAGTGATCPAGPDPCGRGGPATAGRLALPASLHPLPGGGFMFVDQTTSRVRAVHLGTLLELAGGGLPGYTGDGGPALDARFHSLADAEPLPGGGFLVADGLNCRLRRVTADGTVLPFAGAEPLAACGTLDARPAEVIGDEGPARAAWLGVPGYLAAAEDGSVFYADIFDNRIRRIGPDGRIATVAGTGEPVGYGGDGGPALEARLAWPSGVALRPAGGLMFTDSGNHRIRRLDDPALLPAVLPPTWSPGVRPLAAVAAATATVRDGAAPLPVVCPPAPGPDPGCAGTVAVRATGATGATRPYALAPGGRATVSVPPAAGALARLTGSGRLAAEAIIRTRQPSGALASGSQPLTLAGGGDPGGAPAAGGVASAEQRSAAIEVLTGAASARLAGSVRLLLRCSGAPCRARLSLRTLHRLSCRGLGPMRSRRIARGSVNLTDERRRAVVVRLHRHDLRRLGCHRRAQVRVTALAGSRRLGARTFTLRIGARFRDRYGR